MRVDRITTLVALALVGIAAPVNAVYGQTFKIGVWNIMSGKGKDGSAIPGGNDGIFSASGDCTTGSPEHNAWGVGYVQQFLTEHIKNDSAVVALVLNEAWGNSCAKPDKVIQEVLTGWVRPTQTGTSTGERAGVSIIARYGFVGGASGPTVEVLQSAIPPPDGQEERIIMHAQVYVDPARTTFVDVYGTHFDSVSKNGSTAVTKMGPARAANRPHVILGDFNTIANRSNCGTVGSLGVFTQNGYHDTWAEMNTSPGYTATLNTTGCGVPLGAAYKRIDYGFYWGQITPISAHPFANTDATNVGGDAPSDHSGLVFEYSLGPSSGDTVEPVVTVTNPTNNQVVSGNVGVSVTASDNVGITRVDLKRDGTVIKTWTTTPYTWTWDSTTVGNGLHTLQAVAFDAAGNSGESTVTVDVNNSTATFWTGLVNATANGTTLQKTGGCGTCLDSGGISADTIPSGDGHVEFTPSFQTRLYAGLSGDRTNSTDVSQIKFAFSFWADGTWDIRESNVYKTGGPHLAGDLFKIAIETGIVKYYRNGALVYTSAAPPTYPLGLDVTLMTANATVSNPLITSSGGSAGPTTSDVIWINAANTTVNANSIQKSGGCDGCGDAGTISQQTIDAGNGSVDFLPSVGHRFYAGLGSDRSSSTDRTAIDFAFSFWPDSTWDIRELDVYKTGGSYVSGDVFKVSVEAGAVKYYKNGALVYTSAGTPSYPIGLDTTLFTVGGAVSSAHITK